MTFLFQYHFVHLERRTIYSGFPEKTFFLSSSFSSLLSFFLLAHKMMMEKSRREERETGMRLTLWGKRSFTIQMRIWIPVVSFSLFLSSFFCFFLSFVSLFQTCLIGTKNKKRRCNKKSIRKWSLFWKSRHLSFSRSSFKLWMN